MGSLEALEILRECANGEKKVLFSTSLELADIIKRDLESYEKTLISNGDLCVKICKLEEENQKLKKALGCFNSDDVFINEPTAKRFKRAIDNAIRENYAKAIDFRLRGYIDKALQYNQIALILEGVLRGCKIE